VLGRQIGAKLRVEPATNGRRQSIAIALLHFVIDDKEAHSTSQSMFNSDFGALNAALRAPIQHSKRR